MKKVCYYAIGALGAIPALGLIAPAATAATTAAQPAATAAKTVSLKPVSTPASPSITCGVSRSKANSANHLHFRIQFQGHCVHYQQAYIDHEQTGLTERVRAYSADAGRIYQAKLGGRIASGKTIFSNFPNVAGAYNICAALVFNGTSTVAYGPVCIAT